MSAYSVAKWLNMAQLVTVMNTFTGSKADAQCLGDPSYEDISCKCWVFRGKCNMSFISQLF